MFYRFDRNIIARLVVAATSAIVAGLKVFCPRLSIARTDGSSLVPLSLALLLQMAPKIDPTEVKLIYLKAVGGEVGASSALAPKIGPLGLVSIPQDDMRAGRDAGLHVDGRLETIE